MALPLDEVHKIEKMASKPGYLVDKYVKVQNINNAVNACKDEIKIDFPNKKVQEVIFKNIDKWLVVTNGRTHGSSKSGT